ncbi:helix-turn-helix transcriptional regulator [Myceligenerans crystallogenes]|uniref:YafY family protein n=1 Tax=Myceligenerans crystallogenes TaxID=316335 RepID=A0ABN2NAL4_9MICO
MLNLVIALVNTDVAMTRDQVRRVVVGYADAPSDEAFARLFERDKDTLRALGVPLSTVGLGGHTDEVGYRIDQDAYALGQIDLTPAELGVLSLAAQFWADQTLRTQMARALVKLRAAGAPAGAGDPLAGLTPRVRAAGDAYGPLLEAISQRRAVSFRYRAASDGQVRARKVLPWRIAARGGGWYLLSHDVERDAPRVFRLSRIEGRVRLTGPAGAFDVPPGLDTDRMLGRTGHEAPTRTALLAIRPERAAELRARGKQVEVPDDPAAGGSGGAPPRFPDDGDPRDLVEVPFRSVYGMGAHLAGYGAAVLVLDPPELRDDVVRRLRESARVGTPGGARVGRQSGSEESRG